MIRKLNYTGRKKINKSRVNIRLSSSSNGSSSFKADINLDGLSLPADAGIFVEAYHRTSYMRFPFGVVKKPEAPSECVLDRIDPGAIPLFRVKVVDRREKHGRIIAAADKIRPLRADDGSEKDLIPILHVEYDDLDQLVWKLETTDWPTLVLNIQIDNIKEMVRSEVFLSLVHPEIIRMILREIIMENDFNENDLDGEDWQALWLKFAARFPGVGPVPRGDGEADKVEWIDNVVNEFCKEFKTREEFVRFFQEGTS